MIIQCEQCQTKFKLDDSKVADKSIKVRCARCRHVFSVAGTQGVPEDSALFEQNAPVFQVEDEFESAAEPALETASGPEFETLVEEDAADESSLLDSFSFEGEDEPAASETPPTTSDDSDFFLPAADSAVSSHQEEAQKDPDDLDFGAFDFGDESGDAAEPAVPAASMDFDDSPLKQGQAATPPKKEFGGLDFSGDDMFGDVVSTTTDEGPADALSFDMGMDGFADSMGVESSAAGQGTSLASQDSAAETPFSLDDIDFGDDLTSVAVQQVSTEELKPSQELLFAPLAAAQTKPVFDSGADIFEKAPAMPAQEELPPLSISSRRKESPRVSGMLVFMGVIIAALVVFYGTWGYMMLTEDKGKVAQETGRITVRSVEASFIKNKKTGDLLVISGEAVNEYNKPRAAIQIKGIVFGADGEEVSSKSAFCGNPLSKEQLSTMTMDKIEAAMANQFGDSLANMEVAPGAAIPFVIVLAKPPKGATDYGVEPAGSTVATDKEKEK
jgi:predicted Zn finger-like uncharacterized protein